MKSMVLPPNYSSPTQKSSPLPTCKTLSTSTALVWPPCLLWSCTQLSLGVCPQAGGRRGTELKSTDLHPRPPFFLTPARSLCRPLGVLRFYGTTRYSFNHMCRDGNIFFFATLNHFLSKCTLKFKACLCFSQSFTLLQKFLCRLVTIIIIIPL